MSRSASITRFLSGLLLAVFALSITPKKFLHTLFATHVDNKQLKDSNKPYQLSNSGYNCDCDNLVAESPFVDHSPAIEIHVSSLLFTYILTDLSCSSIPGIYSSLRGPPAEV